MNKTDISDVTADSNNFSELPDGYYLSEVEKAELKESKTSHQPMVAFQFKVVEDGLTVDKDGEFKDIKEGAALIACKTNVPIIPTRICGKYKLFSKIKYKIGEPIYTKGKTKEEVTKELFNSIENLK